MTTWTKRTPTSTDFTDRTKPTPQNWLLKEDGGLLLLENGGTIVLENSDGFNKRTPITTNWTKR